MKITESLSGLKNFQKAFLKKNSFSVKKSKGEICQRGKQTIERAMLMEILYRYSMVKQPEIGKLMGGIDYSSVIQARRRLQVRMKKDPKARKRFETLYGEMEQLSRLKI